MSDEEVNETVGAMKIPSKLLEMSSGHFKDRSKRRLSLPIGGRDVRRCDSICVSRIFLSVTVPVLRRNTVVFSHSVAMFCYGCSLKVVRACSGSG